MRQFKMRQPACLLLWLLLTTSFCDAARSQDAPQVGPASQLVILNVPGAGYANVRTGPDPRSDILIRLSAGALDFRATGAVKRYGDTWWVEVQTGAFTGWLNARLIGQAQSGAPLQAFIAIDDFQAVAEFEFKGAAYREGYVTSFEECARSCVADRRCVAVEYRRAPSVCGQFEQRPDLTKRANFDVAAKPVPEPSTGWVPTDSPSYAATLEANFDADGYRTLIAHTAEECALVCTRDRTCSGYEYQPKKLVCALFNRAARIMPKPGYMVGVRQNERVAASALPQRPTVAAPVALPPPAPVAPQPASRPQSGEPVADYRSLAQLFQQLVEDAARTSTFATTDIDRRARVTVTPNDPPVGAAAVQPLEGDAHNLAAMIDRSNGRKVHLVFYSAPGAVPYTVATSDYPSDTAAQTAARKLQADLDKLATLSGLGADRLANLKPMRN